MKIKSSIDIQEVQTQHFHLANKLNCQQLISFARTFALRVNLRANNIQRYEAQQHRRFSWKAPRREDLATPGRREHTCSREFFAEICHRPDEIYQRSRKVCASLAHKRPRERPTRASFYGFFGAVRSILIGPPGRTVGRDFPRRANAVAKGPPHDLQRRPSGKKKCAAEKSGSPSRP